MAPATCGPNAAVATGPSSVTGGVNVSQTATFTLVCPPTTTAATLDAVTSGGGRSGPPGVDLRVSGAGYATCRAVFLFFDAVRIGTAEPGASGGFALGGLSVPGDAALGSRPVVATCRAAGGKPRASTRFLVTSASVHRTSVETALPQPRQVSTAPRALATSAIAALLLVLFLAFPSELFNSTLGENYDEVCGWFRLPAKAVDSVRRAPRGLAFAAMILVGGVAYSALSPSFGFNLTTVALAVGIAVALVVMSVVFSMPADLAIHRRFSEWGKLNILPGSVLVAVAVRRRPRPARPRNRLRRPHVEPDQDRRGPAVHRVSGLLRLLLGLLPLPPAAGLTGGPSPCS